MEAAEAGHWNEAEPEGLARGCSTYLEDHAAYMDGCLNEDEAAAHEAHARSCASCARYSRVLHRGLALVRELPEIEPSAHFEERLRHRIFHIDEAARASRSNGRSLAGLAAAAMIATVAWSPVLWRTLTTDGMTSSALSAPAAIMNEASLAPHVAALRNEWYVQPVSPEIDQVPVQRLVGYAGTYSPLIVSPPAYARGPRAVRLAAATSQ